MLLSLKGAEGAEDWDQNFEMLKQILLIVTTKKVYLAVNVEQPLIGNHDNVHNLAYWVCLTSKNEA